MELKLMNKWSSTMIMLDQKSPPKAKEKNCEYVLMEILPIALSSYSMISLSLLSILKSFLIYWDKG